MTEPRPWQLAAAEWHEAEAERAHRASSDTRPSHQAARWIVDCLDRAQFHRDCARRLRAMPSHPEPA